MNFSKSNLFKTVKSLHDKGVVTLTASERDLIDRETKDLLSAASLYRSAAKAPEGFDSLLEDLKSAKDPDDAFSAIVDFMKQNGDVADSGKSEKEDKVNKGDKEDKEDKEEKGEKSEKGEKVEKEDKKEKLEKNVKPGNGDEKEEGKDKKDVGVAVKKDKDVEKDDLDDLDEEKGDLFARAAKLAAAERKKDLEELKDEDGDEDMVSSADMGIKDANRVTVKITADRNIIVSKDGCPLFFHTTSSFVKRDSNKLRRLANRLLGLTIFEGAKVAAERVGAKLVAGADEGIDLAADVEVPAVTDPVIADAETVIKDELEVPASDVQNGAMGDYKEANKRINGGVDDGIDIAVKDSMDNGVSSVCQTDEDVIEKEKEVPSEDTQVGADVDYRSVESNFKKLYASRASKEADSLNKAFIDRFIRAFRVAAQRMLLNHDEHQFKVAAYDVLMSETDMDEEDAVSVAEGIAATGHTAFVNQILSRTADLMKKSDEYLVDVESDLKNQSVRAATVEIPARRTSSSLKKVASAGNFGVNFRTPATRSINNNVNELRGVIGSTPLSKLATKLKSIKG